MSVLEFMHAVYKTLHNVNRWAGCSLRKAEVARSNRVISTTLWCIFNTPCSVCLPVRMTMCGRLQR